MKGWIGITDGDWYRFLRAHPELEEINFWRPKGGASFRAIQPGEPFLFKLHAPDNVIVGGGYLSGAIKDLPVSLAWECFGPGNGAASLTEMRRQISRYRGGADDPYENYKIGCIILNSPFFLDEEGWIPSPADLAPNVVQGKTYDFTTGFGKALWDEVQLRLRVRELDHRTADTIAETEVIYGDPVPVRPRLGQGAFRALVTEIYERRCAITREKALPVLDAAHIRPVAAGGRHALPNGLLFRSDVHRLFDAGYVSVTPDYRFRVSRRLKDDFDNGEPYYPFDGKEIWLPRRGGGTCGSAGVGVARGYRVSRVKCAD